MEASLLYKKLENNFIQPNMFDEWAKSMKPIEKYLCNNFIQRSIGLECDFTDKIEKVYTAVFPTNEVMRKILDLEEKNVLLFLHHLSQTGNKKPNLRTQYDP